MSEEWRTNRRTRKKFMIEARPKGEGAFGEELIRITAPPPKSEAIVFNYHEDERPRDLEVAVAEAESYAKEHAGRAPDGSGYWVSVEFDGAVQDTGWVFPDIKSAEQYARMTVPTYFSQDEVVAQVHRLGYDWRDEPLE
jgi:hypothetical protein